MNMNSHEFIFMGGRRVHRDGREVENESGQYALCACVKLSKNKFNKKKLVTNSNHIILHKIQSPSLVAPVFISGFSFMSLCLLTVFPCKI